MAPWHSGIRLRQGFGGQAPLLLSALVATAATLSAGQPQPPSAIDLVTTYSQGRYEEAIRQGAAIDDLGPFRLRFVQDVPAWVSSDLALAPRRRAAAAAFLLELMHARLIADSGRFIDLVEFTCVAVRSAGPPAPFELAWHRASVALASRARARLWLLGEAASLPGQPPRRGRPMTNKPDPSPKHLVHARERFPDDPQLQLAQVLAWTWGRDQEPIRNVRRQESAIANARTLPQRAAIVALQPLIADPIVGAEALVRIALIHFTTGEPAAALEVLERAQKREAGEAVRYLSFFSAGRALEALGRPEDAMAQYLEALEVVPGAESATVALGSLQFVHDDRAAAVSRLNEVFDRSTTAADPGRLSGYGSFVHWPALRDAMRAELPR